MTTTPYLSPSWQDVAWCEKLFQSVLKRLQEKGLVEIQMELSRHKAERDNLKAPRFISQVGPYAVVRSGTQQLWLEQTPPKIRLALSVVTGHAKADARVESLSSACHGRASARRWITSERRGPCKFRFSWRCSFQRNCPKILRLRR